MYLSNFGPMRTARRRFFLVRRPLRLNCPPYNVLDLSGEYYITKNLRVFGGISNLTDEN
jgi:outer membrane receptor protein involved in Fe transport